MTVSVVDFSAHGPTKGSLLPQEPTPPLTPQRKPAPLGRHPLSALWGDLPRHIMLDLEDSMEMHGWTLSGPAIVYQNQILDGWHRYQAALRTGVEPRLCYLTEDEDPIEVAVALNSHRRHLSPGERARKIQACYAWTGNRNGYRVGPSIPEVAALAGCSRQTVVRAREALRHGPPPAVRETRTLRQEIRVRCDDEMWAWLTATAERNQISINEVVRQCVALASAQNAVQARRCVDCSGSMAQRPMNATRCRTCAASHRRAQKSAWRQLRDSRAGKRLTGQRSRPA